MIRIKDLQDSLQHLIGWEDDVAETEHIPSDLQESESGLYYQGVHPMLTLSNIKSSLPRFDTSNIGEYDQEKLYHVGDMMKWGGKYWINQIQCSGITPDNSDFNEDYNDDYGSIFWIEYNQLAEFLRKSVRNGIATMANEYVSRKTLEKSSKGLFEHKCLFDASGRIANRIPTTHRLVGYEIQPLKGNGVTTQIHKIGLQMFGATGIVRVYLFHTSRLEPMKTFDLRITKSGRYQWFTLDDCFLPYMGENHVGGSWYLCYNQDDLPQNMEAINISKDWSREPCRGCNVGSVEDWRIMTQYIRVSPFRVGVEAGFKNMPRMFDINGIEYTSHTCYGMNCEISIGCDLTDFIITQKQMFAPVLQRQVAYDLLKRIAYNPEVNVNRNQNNVARQQDIILELDGNTYTRSGGIRGDLKKAYDSIDLDTEGMDSACLACRKRGVKYTIA